MDGSHRNYVWPISSESGHVSAGVCDAELWAYIIISVLGSGEALKGIITECGHVVFSETMESDSCVQIVSDHHHSHELLTQKPNFLFPQILLYDFICCITRKVTHLCKILDGHVKSDLLRADKSFHKTTA